ncbi:hypothetical protein ABGB18_08815 [Nonomuraea sp. B12E4]|uniref:hypothetical protein n=1 Tax=Nonomuraea sp. B12E4 TaxID=3153564 RepID=UPI00325D1495
MGVLHHHLGLRCTGARESPVPDALRQLENALTKDGKGLVNEWFLLLAPLPWPVTAEWI